MVIVFLVALGLVLGSFVNAAVWRLHEQLEGKPKKTKKAQPDLSIVKGRSMCSNCHHPLATKDLIPVFSWLTLRGKCRYCHKPIVDTPLPEIVLPVLLVLSYLAWKTTLWHVSYGSSLWQIVLFGLWTILVTGFLVLALYDARWYILPNRVVFPLVGVAFLWAILRATIFHGGMSTLLGVVWGLLICSGIFWLLFQLSKGKWIGGGDVKLGLVLGMLAGGAVNGMLVLFVASTLGTLFVLPQIAAGKAKRDTHMPFGPFLLAGAFIVVLWGGAITSWYLNTVVLG